MFFSTRKLAGGKGQDKEGEEDGFQKAGRMHICIILMRYPEKRR